MKKYRLLILPAILVTLLSCGFTTAQDKSKDWKLVWSDEFDGHSLRIKSDDGRVIIYGVGFNLFDDGGIIASEQVLGGDLGYSVEK